MPQFRERLESVTLEELADGRQPDTVPALLDEPEAWVVRDTGIHDVVG